MNTDLLQTYDIYRSHSDVSLYVIVYSGYSQCLVIPCRIDDCEFHNVNDERNFSRGYHVFEGLGRLKILSNHSKIRRN